MSLCDIDLSETKADDWSLLGAGRANAVFAYHGARPELVSHVLRLSKPKLAARPHAATSLEVELWQDHEQILQKDTARRFIYFANEFLAPSISKRYLPNQVIAYVGLELAASLLESIGQSSDGVSKTAILLPNNTLFGGPSSGVTVCVELKPKWGSLPTSKAIHPDHAFKYQTSKFCLQQALKLTQGKIDQIGRYDPVELFSGEPNRVVAATVALLKNPQNNLRLFRDGCPLEFGGLNSDGGLCQLADALSNWCDDGSPIDQAAVFAAAVQAVLHDSGVLAQLLQIQNLDEHDIEGVAPLYDMLLRKYEAPPSQPESPTTSPRRESHSSDSASPSETCRSLGSSHSQPPGHGSMSVHKCCKRKNCSAGKRIAAVTQWKTAHALLHAMSRKEQCAVLRSYMTAVTAKDCSVMIAVRPLRKQAASISNEAHGAVKVDTQVFEYKVSVADLDCKPLEKIKEHQLLDADILVAAKKLKEARLLSQGF